MTFAFLAALLALPAAAQTPLEVRRGELKIVVRVKGNTVASDTLRLKSVIEGRVEDLSVSTYTWYGYRDTLGYMANKEMAAIFDSKTSTEKGDVRERWRRVYHPTPFACPSDCFVLRVFAKNKEWVKPGALLVEAAKRIRMIGRVRPEDAAWVKDGQTLEYWPVNDPGRKLTTRISNYVIDIQGEKVEPGGSFTMEYSRGRYLDPGTEWEGVIIPVLKKGVLVVPTDALIRQGDSVYLPVKVSTGMTTTGLTEITGGVADKREILVLDDARLKGALRHAPERGEEALRERIREEYLKKEPKKKLVSPLSGPGEDYGEDPYAE